MASKLPCPFCGAKAKALLIVHDRINSWFVRCGSCSAAGPAMFYRDGAISAWSLRRPLVKS